MKSYLFSMAASFLLYFAGNAQCTLTAAPSVVNPTNCGAINGSILLPGLNGLQNLYAVSYKKNNILTTAELYSSGPDLSIIHLGKGSYTDITIVYNNGTCSLFVAGPFILFDGSPFITATPEADTICPGQSVILNAVGGNIYNWYPATGLNTNTGNMVIATPAQTTTYLVIGSTGPCSNMDSVTLIVTSSLEVSQVANQETCQGNTFPGITFSGPPGTKFRWTNSQPSIGLPAEGKGNLPSFMAANTGSVPVTSVIQVTPENISNGYAYIPRTVTNDLIVFNAKTQSVATSLTVGAAPVAVAIAPANNRIYIANQNSNTVSEITASSHTVTATIPVGSAPSGLAVSPDGSWLYVSNKNANTVSIINTATNTVSKTVVVGDAPLGIAFSTDGSKAYIANSSSNTVSVIDAIVQEVSRTINVGASPISVAVMPDGSRFFVVNSGSNSVSMISVAADTVMATFTTGSQPCGIAIAPDGKKAYITNTLSANISVININAGTMDTPLPVPTAPYGISITADGERLWVTTGTGMVIVHTVSGSVNFFPLTGANAMGDFLSGSICTGTTKTFSITVNPMPSAVISYPAASYCNSAGSAAVQLTGTQGGSFSSSTGIQINPTTGAIDLGASVPGTYQVQYMIPAAGGCASYTTSASITINPLPSQAVITQAGLLLQSSASQGNQWYLNGQPIAGATGQQYTPLQSGTYTVVVTLNGCQGPVSEAFTYIMTSLTGPALESVIRTGPNPVHDLLYIHYDGPARKLYGSLMDASGSQVIRRLLITGNTVVSMHGLASGIYILEVHDLKNGERIRRKVVKD